VATSGVPKVTDFGIASLLRDDNRQQRGGTPEYMAPEQQVGAPTTRRTDLYALGIILHEPTALLLGDSGTGKSFVARLIHEASARASLPLRVIDCAAIPDGLLESELFGSERGAFSAAVATRVGAFEAAGDGTLLLDEIGEVPASSQAKLLRAIESRTLERVGSNKPIALRARVIAATNRDLRAMVETREFRADLYYRLAVVTVVIPSLRDRGDDVLVIADRMLADLAAVAARRVTGFTEPARDALRRYAWPGNARELRNAIEHALVLGEGDRIDVADLPELVRGRAVPASADPMTVQLPANLDWLEARAIDAALVATGGNRTKAAAILGINRVTLQKKLK
jgi:transcriptional regulator with PAS, ATPase and Fis domain